jgi:hypothetical protein
MKAGYAQQSFVDRCHIQWYDFDRQHAAWLEFPNPLASTGDL